MTKTNMLSILNSLLTIRPIFHSEDDLKFKFACELMSCPQVADVFLEKKENIQNNYRSKYPNKPRYILFDIGAAIDIVIKMKNNDLIPVGLKYITKECKCNHNYVTYNLRSHQSDPEYLYRIRKDISRVEKCVTQCKSNNGFVIVISNKISLQKNLLKGVTYGKNYTLHNGYTIPNNDPCWNYSPGCSAVKSPSSVIYPPYYANNSKTAPHWTCKKINFYNTDLTGNYTINWNKYYTTANVKNFYNCVIEV